MGKYQELQVYQRSLDLVISVYKTISALKDFSLKDQIQRAAVSIPSNIAEGSERGSTKDYVRFLYISRGSLAELKTQLLITKRLQLAKSQDLTNLLTDLDHIGKMLNGLIKSLKNLDTSS